MLASANGGAVPASLRQYERRFPEDAVTCANIDTYLQLRRHDGRANNVVAGVFYENAAVRGALQFLDVLLADPLAGGSEAWHRQVQARPLTQNTIFTHKNSALPLVLPTAFARQLHAVCVGLPVLDADTRPRFPGALPPLPAAPNYLQLIEINKPQDVDSLADVCSFFIHVTADLAGAPDRWPRHVRHKVLLTVVDSDEYTPRSLETTPVAFCAAPDGARHVIKVNSRVLAAGIDAFYRWDTRAASQYFESVQASNVLETAKFLLWHVRTENVRAWTLLLIRRDIAAGLLSESQLRQAYDDLRLHDLVQGSRHMHAELQTVLAPQTRAFFRNKLPWYMLYLQNDNVEYTVKDFFSAHFMSRSIDSYSYLRGQLVARLQEHKYAHYSEKDRLRVHNPLQQYKADLINTRVPQEIQRAVYSALVSAFVYYQLPLSALALAGYMWVGVESQTAVAIAALGWVVGFNHVSKAWHDFTATWLKRLFEDVRLVISRDCMEDGLLKELNANFEGAKEVAAVKQQVLADLEAVSPPRD
ncbi:hypothetical protein METBIDRAFT_77014 [Metschnikowia bicuspidata var. bicuspidata NRRL YB-4993]|uniref:Mmc1 C-terminal domain-containing protein n=1 Tax=Metschnikowia bicuspidata var. bicuspidata NRRL YB-4993 TaxID=869754 RepID=A0A1A0HJI6_9ASCO|nr:hypothetical protein METBIDRAFT_77014 [Metschnikowia bicuspidata var. bicuspidata NRRL YB-4993]OBA24161.1 hypothetical protein METBIDRAFT_77014 [Metschnikowia bicuspidata var. bicuspidata NRRL YB-4993]